MRRVVVGVLIGWVVLALGLGGCVALIGGAAPAADGSSAEVPGTTSADGTTSAAGAAGTPAVPSAWESLEQQAAATCQGLSWAVLAAIGRIESDSGRSSAAGVATGANAAGAEGPMHFEAATFDAYETIGPGGADPPSPYDPAGAVFTAAHVLCVDGAATPGGLTGAVFDYDHSSAYANEVLVLASALVVDPAMDATAAAALQFAALRLGTPCRWGGTGNGGFDCSGLVQAAYAAAGVRLPRVAQDQFDAGPPVGVGALLPGDLVFFGSTTSTVEHVGIYLGTGNMIDAPHTGADVRVEAVDQSDLVGATRPG